MTEILCNHSTCISNCQTNPQPIKTTIQKGREHQFCVGWYTMRQWYIMKEPRTNLVLHIRQKFPYSNAFTKK